MLAILRTNKWRWLPLASCFLFGAVFVFAGALKVKDPAQFLTSIRGFQMVPDPFAAWLALALPWLEIFAGLAVITGWLRHGGLLLLNATLVVFIIALGIAWARGLNIECGCFGAVKTGTMVQEIALDVVLLLVGGWLSFIFVRLR